MPSAVPVIDYYISAFKKYAVFSGRASRREYWFFVLVHILVTTLFVRVLIFLTPESGLFIYTLYYFASLIPFLAVSVRRMHDVGKTGWLLLIPVYGFILLLLEGDNASNKYGPVPYAVGP